jgi:hypothetical protein
MDSKSMKTSLKKAQMSYRSLLASTTLAKIQHPGQQISCLAKTSLYENNALAKVNSASAAIIFIVKPDER